MSALTANNIVLIGAGNVATQLGVAISDQGYIISQVYSPTKKSSTTLAKKLNAEAITDIKKITSAASVYIIAVKDDVIEGVAAQLDLGDKIVVHTSGSVPMNVLKHASKNYGVFYPIQTFSKSRKVNFKTIPLCIEASNAKTLTSLNYFGKSISNNVRKVNSDQRKVIHLAAVFACNFTNHLYTISEDILKKNKLSLDLLIPLIEETTEKIKHNSPVSMQTGPAVRDDKKTMSTHLNMLKKDKKYKQLYKLLSESIVDFSQKK